MNLSESAVADLRPNGSLRITTEKQPNRRAMWLVLRANEVKALAELLTQSR